MPTMPTALTKEITVAVGDSSHKAIEAAVKAELAPGEELHSFNIETLAGPTHEGVWQAFVTVTYWPAP
jgi:hypothetical protein